MAKLTLNICVGESGDRLQKAAKVKPNEGLTGCSFRDAVNLIPVLGTGSISQQYAHADILFVISE